MFRKDLSRFWLLGLLLLFLVKPPCSGQGVGKALEKAMKSRAIGTVEEVISHFQNLSDQTINPRQKASVLFLLAEFLMEKQEWKKAAETYDDILVTDYSTDKGGAFYGLAQACLMMNQPERAKAVCARLTADCPTSSMIEFARYMEKIEPDSIHAQLSVYLNVAQVWQPETAKVATVILPASVDAAQNPVFVDEKSAAIKENRLAVGVSVWNSDLKGNIDARGMNLGLSKDTDIGAQTKLALNASWKLSEKDQFRLDYSQFNHSGTLNRSVKFDTLVYDPGSGSVNLKTSFFDVGFSHLLNKSEQGFCKLLGGVKFSHLFMELAQPTPKGTQSGELNQDFSVPYLGIEGNSRLSGNVSLNASIKYLSFNQSGSSDRLTDFDVALLFGRDYAKKPTGTEWHGTLGYRFFLFHAKADNDSSEVSYSGPTFGLESRF